jgi:hypothetical protein
MKTTISTFVTPEVKVKLSNININPSERKVMLTLGTKEKGKKKFNDEVVEATITSELYNYLTLLRKDKIQVVADNERGFDWKDTGTSSTSFQRFLAKKGIEYKSGILPTLVFEGENTSTDYIENPFRLVRYANGNAVLTLVNLPSKSKKETVDVSTGEVKSFYSNKIGTLADGTKVKAFVRPEKYRRLVIQTTKEVEVFQPQQQ